LSVGVPRKGRNNHQHLGKKTHEDKNRETRGGRGHKDGKGNVSQYERQVSKMREKNCGGGVGENKRIKSAESGKGGQSKGGSPAGEERKCGRGKKVQAREFDRRKLNPRTRAGALSGRLNLKKKKVKQEKAREMGRRRTPAREKVVLRRRSKNSGKNLPLEV